MWVRLDDSACHHPKIIKAGHAAVGLWTMGLAYAGLHLTDGYLDESVVAHLAGGKGRGKRLASRLVDVGLWERRESGYQIHDYLVFNPPASSVKDQRERVSDARREAGRRGAEKRWEQKTLPIGLDGNGDGKPMATGMATGRQNDGPDPDPEKRHIHTQGGLSPESAATPLPPATTATEYTEPAEADGSASGNSDGKAIAAEMAGIDATRESTWPPTSRTPRGAPGENPTSPDESVSPEGAPSLPLADVEAAWVNEAGLPLPGPGLGEVARLIDQLAVARRTDAHALLVPALRAFTTYRQSCSLPPPPSPVGFVRNWAWVQEELSGKRRGPAASTREGPTSTSVSRWREPMAAVPVTYEEKL
jgi:hypothetical protein